MIPDFYTTAMVDGTLPIRSSHAASAALSDASDDLALEVGKLPTAASRNLTPTQLRLTMHHTALASLPL